MVFDDQAERWREIAERVGKARDAAVVAKLKAVSVNPDTG